MEIQFLGTGAGMPSKQRNTSSLIVNLSAESEGYWMFDCGEAAQHRILQTTIKPRKINKIFITHLHGDHIFGLPGFIGSRSFLGGTEPLTIYGPRGLREWIETTLRISSTHLNYKLKVVEISEGVIFENEHFRVVAKLLEHVIPSYGFRVEQKPLPKKLLIEEALSKGVPKGPLLKELKEGNDVVLKDGTTVKSSDVTGPAQNGFTFAVLGDTRFCKAAEQLSEDADILIHEATFDTTTGDLAKEYGHSTVGDAAQTAKNASVGYLICNHISARFLPKDLIALKKQGKAIFPELYIADDLSHYKWMDGQLLQMEQNE